MLSPRLRHKLASWLTPDNFVSRLTRSGASARAKAWLEREGVLATLRSGSDEEIKAVWVDLKNLYTLIRTRKPQVVLEFGVGYSTLAIAHALSRNHAEAGGDPAKRPKCWTVDASERWIANTQARIPASLAPYVDLRASPVRIAEWEGQLVSYYERLPNIVPDFVYLDGPDPADVQGDVRGLSFTPETGGYRHIAAADMLLYESTLQAGFFMLLDARIVNMHFLKNNFRREWRVRWNRVFGWPTFELMEWTGRSRETRRK